MNDVAAPGFESIRRVEAFRRFHVRTSLMYGGAVMLTFVLLVVGFYYLWLDSEKKGLQRRLLDVAATIAEVVDVEAISAVDLKNEAFTSLHEETHAQFARIARRDPDIFTIYILRPSDVEGEMYFFVDYVKEGEFGAPGELYIVEDTPVMLEGLERPAVEQELYEDEFGLSLSAYAPLITDEGEHIGLVGIDVQAEQLAVIEGRVLQVSIVILLVSLSAIAFISVTVANSIREPLGRLIRATWEVAHGNLDVHVEMSRRDEFGVLANHFDQMIDDLKDQRTLRGLFGQYMSEDLARSLLADDTKVNLGGEEVFVTILFCDLKSYSTISERLPPQELVGMLNEYLGVMNEIIDEHDGCVIEFLGDAILAVFGAPQQVEDHTDKATRCAIAMREALEDLNETWRLAGIDESWKELGIEKIECRIGLNTGLVVAGNMGSKTRMKYAVIGDAVNLAARLEALNTEYGTTILLSEQVLPGLSPELVERSTRMGKTLVKGRTQPVTIYSV